MGMNPGDAGATLDADFKIAVRVICKHIENAVWITASSSTIRINYALKDRDITFAYIRDISRG